MEPEVLRVELPDGDEEVRLASIDLANGNLILRQVSLGDNREVSLGGSATVKLSSIGAVTLRGKSVKLHGGAQSGKVLLELHFEGPERAAVWSQALRQSSSSGSKPVTPDRTSEGSSEAADTTGGPMAARIAAAAQTASTLRLLISQQEEQAALLEAIHERKAQQALKIQERLEVVLEKLNEGQATYTSQQQVLDDQQGIVKALQSRLCVMYKAASKAEAACSGAASEAAAGWRNVQAASGPARMAPSGPLQDEDTSENGDKEEDAEFTQAKEELVNKHLNLIKEKEQMEAQLKELRELHAMMQVMGLGDSLAASDGDAE